MDKVITTSGFTSQLQNEQHLDTKGSSGLQKKILYT